MLSVIVVYERDDDTWEEIVARYEKRELEMEPGFYLDVLHEFQDLAKRYGEPDDYELRKDARLLAHDLGDRLRRIPFTDLSDNEQDDFLMYSYFFDNPLDNYTDNWSYNRKKGRELHETYSTLSFWFDWINHLEHGTPFPIDQDS